MHTLANSGPELETEPATKWGNFSLTHAAIDPGYEPPKAIHGPVMLWASVIASIKFAKSFCPCLHLHVKCE